MSTEEEEILRRGVENTVAEVEAIEGRLSPFNLSALLFSLIYTAIEHGCSDDHLVVYVRSAHAFKRQREGAPTKA